MDLTIYPITPIYLVVGAFAFCVYATGMAIYFYYFSDEGWDKEVLKK